MIGLVKVAIGIKKLVVFIFKKIGALIGFILKKIFKKPAIILYRQLVKAQFRLSALGIEIKNPLVYALSSKTLGYILLLVIGGFVVGANIISKEKQDDFFQPQSTIARIFVSEEDQIFTEEFDTSPSIEIDLRNNLASGITTPTTDEESTDEGLVGESGDVSLSSGALLKPVIPSTTEGTTAPETIRTYVVQEGDSLGGIATKFGLRIKTVAQANNLTEKSKIRPGQRLVILPTDGILYTIKRGDTLGKIAQTYNGDTNRIIAYNKLSGTTDIHAGETIIIPGGSVPESAAIAQKPTPKKPTASRRTENIPSTISRSAGMVWPTSATRLTQYFSWRHTGVDIAGPIGNKIYAASSGTVIISAGGYNGGYGKTIVIDHGNGLRTRYGHASKLLVSKGDYVEKGEVIAIVGSTGRSTGPHLHFEVLSNGKKVNPLSYVRR